MEIPSLKQIERELFRRYVKDSDIYKKFNDFAYFLEEGGRGSGKTQRVARLLLFLAMQNDYRIFCGRETQRSIEDSVYKVFVDLIYQLGLPFEITKTYIKSKITNSELRFAGFREQGRYNIQGLEGIDILWIDEAQAISKLTLDIIIPTIRKPNSKVIFSMNRFAKDPVYENFSNRPDCLHLHSNYLENKFLSKKIIDEAEWSKKVNYEDYLHIWMGQPKTNSDSLIFKGKYFVEDFDAKDFNIERFFLGADWGFANDPTAITRSFIHDKNLYIDYADFGYGVELDDIPVLFSQIPNYKHETIYADCSRPETISHLRNKGLNVVGAKKWSGSVEDGVAYLKNFEKIIIHPRCKYLIDEFSLYCYKVDKITNEILPIIIDKNNHGIDSLRYAHEKYITAKKGGVMIF